MSPPQRTASCENSIGQMEAVAQFSYSHRYKKRGKFVSSLPNVYKPSKFSLYFGLSKTVIFFFFVEFNFDKNWKGIFGGRLGFSYSKRYKLTIFNSFWAVEVLWKIDFGNSPRYNFLAIGPYVFKSGSCCWMYINFVRYVNKRFNLTI